MSTMTEMIDRLHRDYLYPPDARPARGRLATTVNTTITTIVYSPAIFDEPEEDLLAEGVIVEIDLELMRILTVDITGRSFTVDRAVMGSAAAAHTAAADIIVSPNPARLSVFDAIADDIDGLYDEDLYRVRMTSITAADGPIDMPEDTEEILAMRYNETTSSTSRYLNVPSYELFKDFDVATDDVAVQLVGAINGRTVYIAYEARFPRPDAESDDLSGTSFGIPTRWERIIRLGAVASLLPSLDLDRTRMDYIAQSLEAEGVPVGTGTTLLRSIVSFRNLLIRKARNAQMGRYSPGIRQADLYWTS